MSPGRSAIYAVIVLYGGGTGCNPVGHGPARFDSLSLHQLWIANIGGNVSGSYPEGARFESWAIHQFGVVVWVRGLPCMECLWDSISHSSTILLLSSSDGTPGSQHANRSSILRWSTKLRVSKAVREQADYLRTRAARELLILCSRLLFDTAAAFLRDGRPFEASRWV